MMTNGIRPDWLRPDWLRRGASRHAYRSRLLTHDPSRQPAERSAARGIILGLLLGLGFWTIIGLIVWR
jgi:hypothetical protein